MEYVLLKDYCVRGYDEDGNCTGVAETVCHPERLKWTLDEEVQKNIGTSLGIAQTLIDDVEMALLVWTKYGKGFVKKLKISPDAFVSLKSVSFDSFNIFRFKLLFNLLTSEINTNLLLLTRHQ